MAAESKAFGKKSINGVLTYLLTETIRVCPAITYGSLLDMMHSQIENASNSMYKILRRKVAPFQDLGNITTTTVRFSSLAKRTGVFYYRLTNLMFIREDLQCEHAWTMKFSNLLSGCKIRDRLLIISLVIEERIHDENGFS